MTQTSREETMQDIFNKGFEAGKLAAANELQPLVDAISEAIFAFNAIAEIRLPVDAPPLSPRDVADTVAARPLPVVYAPALSPRERTILSCLLSGDPNKAIARKVDIAEATVKAHVKAILRKIRVQNRTQAAVWAFNHGLNPAKETEQ